MKKLILTLLFGIGPIIIPLFVPELLGCKISDGSLTSSFDCQNGLLEFVMNIPVVIWYFAVVLTIGFPGGILVVLAAMIIYFYLVYLLVDKVLFIYSNRHRIKW
jgi:hypothetical protein